MQTKVTVIPILMHKWHSCDFAHCIVVQYLPGLEQKMEILYIIEPPPLINFILAHSDQVAMDFKKFFFHTLVLMPSNYNNAIIGICWAFHYHLKLARSKKKIQLVKRQEILLFENEHVVLELR